MNEYKLSTYKRRSASVYSEKSTWERPFTAKRYLHPPFSERVITMWPSFMVMCGDVVETTDVNYNSSGYRILVGEDLESVPFDKINYYTRDDGMPIHKISYDYLNYTVSMESFCNMERKSSSFNRIRIKNNSTEKICAVIGLIARTGLEKLLTGMEVDGYCHYNQNIANWGFIRSTWKYDNMSMTDGTYCIKIKGDGFDVKWIDDTPGSKWHHRHLLKISCELNPNEEKFIDICFDKGEVKDFDFDKLKSECYNYWLSELNKIKIVLNNTPQTEIIQKNFTCQMLQMFAYPIGKDYIIPRQGGLQRACWPVEAMEFLTALDKYGDYYSYTEKAYDTFFNILQVKDGEDKGCVLNLNGQMWASNTGGAVWGLCNHLICRNSKELFLKYRPSILLAYEWMQKKRYSTNDYPDAEKGVFPPMQATDWPGKFQSWCYTDGNNLMGYELMADLFEFFNDERADEIRKAYNDYMSCMRKILNKLAQIHIKDNEFNVTNRLGYAPVDPQIGAIGNSAINLVRAKVIEPDTENFKLLENFYINRGYGQNGLMGLMNDGILIQGHNSDIWAGHTWYTSMPDICWFYAWLSIGQIDKAKATLDSQLEYSMSPEYYMCERYADNDPYFVPWMPNASAMGRTMMMLMEYYKFQERR